jgi:hypothetical protein
MAPHIPSPVPKKRQKPTYLRSGKRVSAQRMALIPPMTSSFEGAGPLADQMPLST